MTDNEIIENIRSGNNRAYIHLYKHRQMILKMVRNGGGSVHDADDIFQNTMIRLNTIINDVDFVLTSKLSTLIYSISNFMWLGLYTYNKKFSTDKIPEQTDNSKNVDQENLEILNNCLNKLTEQERKLIVHTYFDDMTHNEIAEILGYNNSDTAKNMKCRAMRKLEKIVKGEFERDDFFYK